MPGDLYYGDNLDIMRHKVASDSVDLIYLDPPFNSDRTYNLLHKGSQAQSDAFFDTWHWDDKSEAAFRELTDRIPQGVNVPQALSEMMIALRTFLAEHRDTLAYLSMMAIRLVEMRRILRPTGSLYLHCDPTASHYLKMILDAVFTPRCFRNEIIWKRTTAHSSAKKYAPVHDTILYYSKSDQLTWNAPRADYEQEYLDKYYRFDDGDGRLYWRADICAAGTRKGSSGMPWRGIDPAAKGMHWKFATETLDELDKAGRVYWPKRGTMPQYKRYREELKGKAVPDIWDDIDRINPVGSERVGYATQKPVALLTRIIEASSNEGDLVLDPFCGCGTTVDAAERLKRKWIGIDIAIRAVDVMKDRLDDKFTPRVWAEHGEPADVDQAARLAERNAYDFQWWAVRMLGGRPPKGEKKKGGDGGIDGELTLADRKGTTRRGVISVKGGRSLTPDFVRSLSETVRQEKADFGVLVTMHEPTHGMRDVARECGPASWASEETGKLAHRIRIITVPEIMAGQIQWPGKLDRPRTQSAPPPPEARKGENLSLPFAPRTPKVAKAKAQKPGLTKAPTVPPPGDTVRKKARR